MLSDKRWRQDAEDLVDIDTAPSRIAGQCPNEIKISDSSTSQLQRLIRQQLQADKLGS